MGNGAGMPVHGQWSWNTSAWAMELECQCMGNGAGMPVHGQWSLIYLIVHNTVSPLIKYVHNGSRGGGGGGRLELIK